MNKREANQAMRKGIKITHSTFSPEEWITINDEGKVLTEDGYSHDPWEFWKHRQDEAFNDGWKIFKEKIKSVSPYDILIEELGEKRFKELEDQNLTTLVQWAMIQYEEKSKAIIDREELKEKIQGILDSNFKRFNGVNEAELHICEEIADMFEKQVSVLHTKDFWEQLSSKFYKSYLIHQYKEGEIDYNLIHSWFLDQQKAFKNNND